MRAFRERQRRYLEHQCELHEIIKEGQLQAGDSADNNGLIKVRQNPAQPMREYRAQKMELRDTNHSTKKQRKCLIKFFFKTLYCLCLTNL